jgi:hypothetical protein
MSIATILDDRARWTWGIMEQSAQLAEMIREDAITSVNLATAVAAANQEGLKLHVMSFQGAHLEIEYGADWFWAHGNSAYLVQAKRLDVIAKLGSLSYLIDLPQLDRLIESAAALSRGGVVDALPAYVFYNSMLPDIAHEFGCIWLNAIILREKLDDAFGRSQQTARVSAAAVSTYGAATWRTMFAPFDAEE